MNVRRALMVGALALSSTGCGGSSVELDSATHRQLLADVPELRGAQATPGGGGAAGPTVGTSRGGGGGASLPPGFTGTQQLSGRFGGPESAQSLSAGCPGWVAAQPNHLLYNASELPFVQLVVNANPFDTTLVVELPDGSFACNDDSSGLNPAVSIGPLPAGQVRIWVGSYSQGQEGDYRLVITTDPNVDAASIGSPSGE